MVQFKKLLIFKAIRSFWSNENEINWNSREEGVTLPQKAENCYLFLVLIGAPEWAQTQIKMKDSIDREKATGFWLCSILKSVFESENESHSVLLDSLRPLGLYSPWNSPDQNTRMGSLSLLKGMFPTQGSNPGLQHFRQIHYQLSHKRSPNVFTYS